MIDYEKLAQDAAATKSSCTSTGKEMAEIFGLTKGRVSQLAKEGVFVKRDEYNFDFKQSVKNYLQLSKTAASSAPLIQAKIAKAQADARVAKIAADIAERNTIKISDAEDVLAQIAGKIRAELLAMRQTLPERLAGLDAGKIASIIETEVPKIMESIYQSKF
jgi:phage terminase Nu1 subunit (DNA packaging protein)